MSQEQHRLGDLIDIRRLQRVCDGLAAAAGIGNAILDPEGAILASSGWSDICAQFHRRNETTVAGCLESDLRINEAVHDGLEAPRHIAYKCANGMWDVAVPLVIAGEHVANVFTGQFFYDDDEIDVKAFRQRAHEVGFDEEAYLAALGRVPVVSHAHAARTIDFLTDFVGMLGELGLATLREEQAASALRAGSEALQEAQAMARLGRWELDLANDRLDWSPGVYEIFEADPRSFEPSYKAFTALIHPDDRKSVDAAYRRSLEDRRPYDITHRLLMSDGRVKWVHERCRTDYGAKGVALRSVGTVQDVTEQVAAETALRESEERLRLANKATNDVIWDWDVVRDAQRWSPAGASVFGWTDIVDHPQTAAWWAERIHPDDRQRVDEGFFAVVDDPEKSAWLDDYRFRKADGSYAQVMDRGFVIRDDHGQAVRMIGALLDMTERKQVESALRHSEEKFAKAFHSSPDAILITRVADGLIVDANEGFVELSGFTREEAIGVDTLALGVWADPHDRERVISALRTEGSVRDLEVDVRVRSGRTLRCLMAASSIDVDGVPHLLTVVRDVTAQRDAEAARERSEAVLRGIMENLQDAYVRTDLEGRFVMVSPSAARLYRFDSTDEMIGIPSESLYASEETRERLLAEVRTRGQVTDFIAQGRRKDDSTFWVSLNAQYYRDADGVVAGIEGFVRDITERRRTEESLSLQARISGVFLTCPGDEMYQRVLDVVLGALESRRGTFAYLDDDGAAVAPTRAGGDERGAPQEEIRFPAETWGDAIWAQAIRNKTSVSGNEPEAAREGHPPADGVLVAPVLDADGVIGYLEVAGRSGGYSETERERLEEISRFIAPLLAARLQRRRAEKQLRDISWMLSPRDPSLPADWPASAYGDLTLLNTCRIILDAVPKQTLEDIAGDAVGLLDTSTAVYEKNGDYALGIFASDWCRFMDAASRRLCPGDDAEALRSGRWLCHESCWTAASRIAVEKRRPVDIQCSGGLRLYALPVIAGDDVVGSVNIGYGDPPRDPARLDALAERYQVDADELKRLAEAYEPRPQFIVDHAKRRLASAARLIGALVEAHRSHSDLATNQQRYETFINATDDMAFLKDDESRYVIVNAANAAYFGRPIDEVIGHTDAELMPPGQAAACHDSDAAALARGGVVIGEEEADGRVYETRKFPVPLPGGAAGVGGYIRDMTERRRAEAEVARLNADLERRVAARTAQLEAANKELESFAYSISHDLRSPLRAADGFSEILREDYGDRLDAEGLAHLERISGAVHHMTGLMDGLLQLSRLNREDLDRCAVDLGALAAEILGELRARDAGRTVDERIGDDLVADADPRLTRIVLQNLIGNAWKFTSRHDTAHIDVGATRSDGGRTFYVRDDGAGFDMRYADKLFGAFQRLHTPDQFEGTGIGLATVQRIVHRHGGSVWAEAEVEKGATFWFTLDAPGGD